MTKVKKRGNPLEKKKRREKNYQKERAWNWVRSQTKGEGRKGGKGCEKGGVFFKKKCRGGGGGGGGGGLGGGVAE